MSATGLPSLPASVNVFDVGALLVADAVATLFGAGQQQWGIFLDGVPVVLADNVVMVDYKQDWRLSTYPQESGAFATYNKVAVPFEAMVRFSTGGSDTDRQSFLDSIAAIAGDLNLYDVVMPEQIYSSCNITHYDLSRAAEKVGLISVDVRLEQVVIAASAAFSNTQSPASASPVSNGLVQGQSTEGGGAPAHIMIFTGGAG